MASAVQSLATCTVTVRSTLSGIPTVINGGLFDTVNVGHDSTVQDIQGSVSIEAPFGSTTVNIDNSADLATGAVTLSTVAIANDIDPQQFGETDLFGEITGLANAPIAYEYADTQSLTVSTGIDRPMIDVQATGTTTNLFTSHVPLVSAGTAVSVGAGGSVQGILGALKIANIVGAGVSIVVDDSGDSAPRTVTLENATTAGYGVITGLVPAPAEIDYRYAGTSSLNVLLGTASNTVNVQATGASTVVRGNTPVGLHGGRGNTIDVGNAHNTQGILAALTLSDPPGLDDITIDDSVDSGGRSVVLDDSATAGYGMIAGLAEGSVPIAYAYGDTNTLTINLGSGPNTVNVRATGVPPAFVGGVMASIDALPNTSATLSGVTVSAGGDVGGIDNDGTLIVSGCTITGNYGASGGSILNFGSLTLTHSTVSGNTATQDGGGIENVTGGTLQVIDSVISGNTASGKGGGIHNEGTLTIADSTLSGNWASSGNGVYNINHATLSVVNSILWDHAGGEIVNNAADGSTAQVNYSDVQNGWSGAGAHNVNADPMFVSSSNLQLKGVSPCIDLGNDALVVGGPTDLAGNYRIVGQAVDMGAYEFQGQIPPAALQFAVEPTGVTVNTTTPTIVVNILQGGQLALNDHSFVSLSIASGPPVRSCSADLPFRRAWSRRVKPGLPIWRLMSAAPTRCAPPTSTIPPMFPPPLPSSCPDFSSPNPFRPPSVPDSPRLPSPWT